MQVRRIVTNLAVADGEQARRFYQQVLGLEVLMDHGWIQTLGSDARMAVQLSLAAEGGSDTAVPLLSVEVDDLDEALRRAQAAGAPIVYGPAVEPWGVRRFYVRDPLGNTLNILQHI